MDVESILKLFSHLVSDADMCLLFPGNCEIKCLVSLILKFIL